MSACGTPAGYSGGPKCGPNGSRWQHPFSPGEPKDGNRSALFRVADYIRKTPTLRPKNSQNPKNPEIHPPRKSGDNPARSTGTIIRVAALCRQWAAGLRRRSVTAPLSSWLLSRGKPRRKMGPCDIQRGRARNPGKDIRRKGAKIAKDRKGRTDVSCRAHSGTTSGGISLRLFAVFAPLRLLFSSSPHLENL